MQLNYLYYNAGNKEPIFDTRIYLFTFTNYKWIPLFRIINGYEFVYKWFDILIEQGNSVLGFVLCPITYMPLLAIRKQEKVSRQL
jgi:hypothetical protein